MTIQNSISDVDTILMPTPASTAIEIGDLLFNNSGTVAKASSQTDQTSETLNQRLFASLFLGVSAEKRLSTETDTRSIVVRTDCIVDATCPSTTWAVGDLVGASENGDGDALLNQQVEKVTDPSLAIGYCTKAGTSITTVRVRLIGKYTPSVVRAPYVDPGSGDVLLIGSNLPQTISNGDGTTDLSPNVQILGTTKATASILIGSWNTTNDTTVAPSLNFLKSGAAAIGSNTVVASGEILGEINFFGADGTDFESPAARISAEVDATAAAGDMPGRLVFSTTADAGETLTEAMRIDSAQMVTCKGSFAAGANATDRVTIKGFYMSPANVAVTVPAITDPDIAKVDINVASAFAIQPAVGDAVIAIPQEAMETNARIQGCYVTGTDQITLVFGSEGGNVTGGSKNFKFLVFDLT